MPTTHYWEKMPMTTEKVMEVLMPTVNHAEYWKSETFD